MGDAVGGEQIAQVEPKARLRIMRVTILEVFDVANGLRTVETILELRDSNPDWPKVCGRDLSRGAHGNAASHRN
jgi:hypothetical protein